MPVSPSPSPSPAAGAAKLRAWWAHRQGLDGSLAGRPPAEVLERCGWARSVGGVGPYLTLHARAGTGRAEADAAVAQLEIHELPSARGCTYVLPASDFALGLTVGRDSGDAERRVAAKLGVTDAEIEALCAAVLGALGGGAPLEPDAIRAFAPPAGPHYVLVSSLDPISATRRGVAALLDDADRARTVLLDAKTSGLADLPSHAILDRGRLVGLWEFDPEAGTIAWATFGATRTPALREAVAATEAFVRDELGDARSFGLDSPAKRRPRIEALRTS